MKKHNKTKLNKKQLAKVTGGATAIEYGLLSAKIALAAKQRAKK